MFSPAATSTPFGQAASTPTFGAPAPFGSTTPSANTQSTGGFGFGSSANNTPAFGSNTGTTGTTSTGFGGFGSTNNTSSFGASATTTTSAQSPFGAPAPATGGLFGSASTPQSAATTGGGLFGAPAATSNAFGAPSPAPSTGFGGFGAAAPAPAAGGLFGAPAPAPATGGLFGAPAPATGGLFGAPAPAVSGFGAPAAAPATTGFGGFGAPAAQTIGTTSTPYQATTHPDGNDSITLQAISAMPAYQDKSFEELRVEDYTAGNKGSQGKAPASTGFGATTTGGFGGFGSPSPAPQTNTGSVFGAPAPAQATGGLFGAPAPAPAAGGLFGAPAPAPAGGGLFGAPAAAPVSGGLFGAPAPAPAGGLFGAPASAAGGLFGAPAPAPAAGGLFGAPAPAAGGLFGAPAPAPVAGGLFGAPAPAPAAGGLFGAPAPAPAAGGLFGAPAAAPVAGGLFGAPAPAPAGGGLFGAPAPAPAAGGLFGAPAPAPVAGGLFGAPAPAAGGLFGAPAPAPVAGGLFGAPAPAAGGLFGAAAPAPATGGLFGAPAPAPVPTTALAPYVAPPPPNSDVLLAQQLAAVEEQKKELALLEPWRGKSPAGSSVIPSSLSERDAAAFSGPSTNGSYVTELGRSIPSYASSSAAMNSFQSPRSLTRIRPRGFGSSKAHMPKIDASSLRSNGSSSLLSPDSFISSSAKRLVIQPGSLAKPKMKLALTNGNEDNAKAIESEKDSTQTLGDIQKNQNSTPLTSEKKIMIGNRDDAVFAGGFTSPTNSRSNSKGEEHGKNVNGNTENGVRNGETFKSPNTPSQTNGYSYDLYREIVASPDGKVMSPSIQRQNDANSHSHIPKLTKSGYIVSPTIEAMSNMSEADLAAVSKFTVSRPGFGTVAWDGAVDVRNVDLDSVVCIREKEVIVYEKEEADGNKPDVGSKLNRPAVIMLNKIFPKGGEDASSDAKLKFTKKIEKKTEKMDAEFVSYDPYDGIWKFRTKHFSRYGLDSDDDEDDDMEVEKVQPSANSNNLHLVPGDGISTLAIASKGRFGMDEDTQDENAIMVSDHEDAGEGNEKTAIVAAENAYRSFLQMETSAFDNPINDDNMDEEMGNQLDTRAGDINFKTPQNMNIPSQYVMPKPSYPDLNAMTQRGPGLCERIAQKYGMKSTTSVGTDFSLRMRRSFRVAWKPDGTIVIPSKQPGNGSLSFTNKFLVERRPLLQESRVDPERDLLPMLQTHFRHRKSVQAEESGCPLFELPKGLGTSGGTAKSYELLCSALDEYIQAAKKSSEGIGNQEVDTELQMTATRALSLISTLYGQEQNAFSKIFNESLNGLLPVDDNVAINSGSNGIIANNEDYESLSSASERRYEGLISWLSQVSKKDTNDYIVAALDRNDPLTAVLVALTGGDTERACEIASNNSYGRLSLMISNGFQNGSKSHLQRQLWHETGSMSKMPMTLNRIYALLSSDLDLEEKLYANGDSSIKNSLDWRQRLGMKLWFSEQSPKNLIASIIDEYDEDVSAGIAPPPQPRYKKGIEIQENTLKKDYCILYRLLRLRASGGGKDGDEYSYLLNILSPRGYTKSSHDYSLSFHVAALLQYLGVCPGLSDQEEGFLGESFAQLLANAGLWEWALYVMLCVGPSEKSGPKSNRRRSQIEMRAKKFFLRHFHCNGSESTKIRGFLQNQVGIPSTWFEEALAIRSAYNGDSKSYISHLIAGGKAEEATIAIERLILPSSIIEGGESLTNLKNFLISQRDQGLSQATRWDGNNGCGAILDFLLLSDEVARLLTLSDYDLYKESSTVEMIVEKGKDLRTRMVDHDDKHKISECAYIDYHMFASCTEEQRAISFVEASSNLNVLLMQIEILESKVSYSDIIEDDLEPNNTATGSRLAFLAYSERGGSESISTGDLVSNPYLRGVSSSFLTRV